MTVADPFKVEPSEEVRLAVERAQKRLFRQILRQLRIYSLEAKGKGYTGPEQVYKLAGHRLSEDITL